LITYIDILIQLYFYFKIWTSKLDIKILIIAIELPSAGKRLISPSPVFGLSSLP